MHKKITNWIWVAVLIFFNGVFLSQVIAENSLTNFKAITDFTPNLFLNGINPYCLAKDSDGNFYGATRFGGKGSQSGDPFSGGGTLFKMTPSGALTTLISFTGHNGSYPASSLIKGKDGNFYGVTSGGGFSGNGTVFKLTPAGKLTTVASFTRDNGSLPMGNLVQDKNGNFYGLTSGGGFYSSTVFKLTPNGILTTLVSFDESISWSNGLVQGCDGNFYGMTYDGGFSGRGSIFKVTPRGELTTLVSFDGTNGAFPACLISGSNGYLYGTTIQGGSADQGTIFKITHKGKLTTLLSFDGTNGSSPVYLRRGSGNYFYGTTAYGGSANHGTVFKITHKGKLTTLISFNGTNGSHPSFLIQDAEGNFFGAAEFGGSGSYGTIFKITGIGELTSLVSFSAVDNGAYPAAGLTQGRDGDFYGTTSGWSLNVGDVNRYGTIFKMTPEGELTTLTTFNETNGAHPSSNLIQGRDGNFYGTTSTGGSSTQGTVFKMTPTGELITLVSFNGTNGAWPKGNLIQGSDGNFYGTTTYGGNGYGTVFRITPTSQLTVLVSFNEINGALPVGGVIQARDGNFYGTTVYGGDYYGIVQGTVFRMTPEGELNTLALFDGANGLYPEAGLVQGSDGNFYGTTVISSFSNPYGTVFRMTPMGELTTLVSFNGINGARPEEADLIQGSDGNFYGTTIEGGAYGHGTVFGMPPTGELVTIVSLNQFNGAHPRGGLIQGRDGNFYGTTTNGGRDDRGTVFCVNPSTLANVVFSSSDSPAETGLEFMINEMSLNLILKFAPTPGTILTILNNIGMNPINGTYSNLPDGGTISAVYDGINYTFTANYASGDGNDLTLICEGVTH